MSTPTKTTYDLWYGRIRDALFLLWGLGIVTYETVVASTVQPYLLVFAASLLSIPLTLKLDKKLRE